MLILAIETSTSICSAALLKDGVAVGSVLSQQDANHASVLPLFIEELLARIPDGKIDAVALSQGPGSYTGLRIGTSLAKGLAYGRNIPLVAVSTLEILLQGALSQQVDYPADTIFCPMLDARRMEVYTAQYHLDGTICAPIIAKVIDANSFQDELTLHPMVFMGDGAPKCEAVICHPNAHFMKDIQLSAEFMGHLAEEKLRLGQVEDVAYFEPFYLKEFVAAPSHIKGLT